MNLINSNIKYLLRLLLVYFTKIFIQKTVKIIAILYTTMLLLLLNLQHQRHSTNVPHSLSEHWDVD